MIYSPFIYSNGRDKIICGKKKIPEPRKYDIQNVELSLCHFSVSFLPYERHLPPIEGDSNAETASKANILFTFNANRKHRKCKQ